MANDSALDDLDVRVETAELGRPEDRAALMEEIDGLLSSTNPSNADRLAHLLGLKARLASVDRGSAEM